MDGVFGTDSFDFAGLGIEFTAKLSQLFGFTHDVLPLVQAVRLPLRAPTVTKQSLCGLGHHGLRPRLRTLRRSFRRPGDQDASEPIRDILPRPQGRVEL
jgi:hypothetical protein